MTQSTEQERALKDIEKALRLTREAHQHEVDAYRPELHKPECDRRPKYQLDRLGDLICLLQNILYAEQQAASRAQVAAAPSDVAALVAAAQAFVLDPSHLKKLQLEAHAWGPLAGVPRPSQIQPKVCKTEIQTKGCIEAACNPSMQPELATQGALIESREVVSTGSGLTVTRCNLSEAGRAALQSKADRIPAASEIPGITK